MALYELVLIMGKNLAAEEVDKNISRISDALKENEGELISKEYWGLRKLLAKSKTHLRSLLFTKHRMFCEGKK